MFGVLGIGQEVGWVGLWESVGVCRGLYMLYMLHHVVWSCVVLCHAV